MFAYLGRLMMKFKQKLLRNSSHNVVYNPHKSHHNNKPILRAPKFESLKGLSRNQGIPLTMSSTKHRNTTLASGYQATTQIAHLHAHSHQINFKTGRAQYTITWKQTQFSPEERKLQTKSESAHKNNHILYLISQV